MRESNCVRLASRAIFFGVVIVLSAPAWTAPVSWINPGDGFWDVAGNWNPALPGAADDVTISIAGLHTITHRSGTDVVNSLTSTNSLAITGGSLTVSTTYSNTALTNISGGVLTLNGASSMTSLSITSGTLSGTGAVTVSGASDWSGGGMSGTGSTTFNGALALTGNGARNVTARNVNFAGTTTWTNTAGGSGGRFQTGSGATLTNSGTFLDQTTFDTTINNGLGGGGGTFVNSGSYVKSGATTTNIATVFNNAASGVVTVNAGTLVLSGGGTSSGSFDVASGAVLNFNGGTHNVSGIVSGTGTGQMLVSSGTVNTSGVNAFGGQLALSGGILSVGGTFNAVGFGMTGGTQTGAGTLTISDAGSWSAGSMDGTGSTTFNGPLALTGNGVRNVTTRNVNFAGTTTWTNTAGGSGGRFQTGSGATLTNSGTFLDQTTFDTSINTGLGGTVSTFVNSGSYIKSGATTTSIPIVFNNTGTGAVTVNAGMLNLSGGGTSSGSFDVASGAVLNFVGGTHNLSGVVSGSGTGQMLVSSGVVNTSGVNAFGGQLAISGGSFNVGGTFSAVGFGMTGGTQTGVGALTISDAGSWSGGSMDGTGSTTFNGALALTGNGVRNLTTRNVNFAGTTTWTNTAGGSSGRFQTGDGATLTNSGTFLDQTTFDTFINTGLGGTVSTFVNSGNYIKSGPTTTNISTAFNNTGTGVVTVSAGTLTLAGGGTSSGTFDVASGAVLAFGGTHNLSGVVSGSGTGQMLVFSGTVNTSGVNAFGGQLAISAGILSVGGTFDAVGFGMTGGTQTGTGTLTISDGGSWSSGSMGGTGSTTFNGALALTGNGVRNVTTRNVNFAGTTTWTNTAGGSSGRFQTGSAATLTNSGTFLDQTTFDTFINTGLGGTVSTFVNSGSYIKSGAATTNISTVFNNTGTVDVQNGILLLSGTVTNHSGGTLTGGIWQADASSSPSATIQLAGANITTNAADIYLIGANSHFNVGATAIDTTLATNNGALRLQQGRSFNATGNSGNFTNGGTGLLELTDSTFQSSSLLNSGIITSFGTSTLTTASKIAGNGGINVNTGTLTLSSGVNGGATSSANILSGATLNLASSATPNVIGTLTTSGNLALGGQNLTVLKDYNNANSGTGNDFNARANVSGAGQIVGSNAAQTVTGSVVAAGANTWTLDLGNVRGGTTKTVNYQIANNGTGADIRGAIQTGAPGLGNISDGRLTGAGVTAANFGPLAAGTNTGNLGVTFTATSGGSLSGQNLAVVSNFSNVATQTINVSGFSTALAQGVATPNTDPVNLGNFHLGSTPAQNFNVQNSTSGAGAERLGIGSVATTGNFTAANNLGSGFIAGGASQSNAVTASISAGVAGVNTGSVTIQYTTNGTLIDPLFVTQNANAQTINLSATGYNLAAATINNLGDFNLGSVLVGGGPISKTVSLTNTAVAGAFSEALNASFGTVTNSGVGTIGTSGSIAGLLAGQNNNLSLVVTYTPTTAGAINASVQLLLASNGTAIGNGLGITALPDQFLALLGNVTGTAGNLAQASAATPNPVVFGNVRVGAAVAPVALNIGNVAVGPAEGLNGSIATATPGLTATGTFTSVAPGASSTALSVGMNTTSAGSRNGTATITLASDGSFNGGVATPLPSQTVNVTGGVYQIAQPSLPSSVSLGNAHVGGTLSQAISIGNTNTAPGFQEGLNASVAGTTGAATAAGTVANLAAGASNNTGIVVGLNTAVAGAQSGTVTLGLQSNGAGTSGLSTLDLPNSAPITISGGVYNLAAATINNLGDFNLGSVLVGGGPISKTVSLTNTAVAGAFSEALNASFGTVTNSGVGTIGTSGSIAGLLAGQNNNLSLVVTYTPTTAGAINASVQLLLASNGTAIGNGLGITALPDQFLALLGNVTGTAGNLAQASAATPNPVVFGNVRVGAAVAPVALNIGNVAVGPAEGLNGSIATATPGLTATGTFTSVAPGASSTALSVGMNTTSAGSRNGTATITLASDGSFNGGVATPLPSQTVNVTGGVYRLANPTVDTTPIVLAARVGGAASAIIGVTNTSPDAFTEGLNVTRSAAPAGFTGSGAITNLAPGASSNAIQVSLNTASAGSFTGNAQVLNLASNGSITGNADASLGTASVDLTGHVYTPAVTLLNTTTPVDFGIVHVGDAVSQALAVKNDAPLTALNDALLAAFGTATSGVSGSGNLGAAGLAAQATDSSSLKVGLDTGAAGVVNGTATFSTASHDAELADLALADLVVAVQGTVNNYALSAYVFGSGAGSFSQSGDVYTLDLGSVLLGSGSLSTTLFARNAVAGPADLLDGLFQFLDAPEFNEVFNPFSNLAASTNSAALLLSLNATTVGSFSDSIVLHGTGHNASGYSAPVHDITLIVRGEVREGGGGTVPEPGTLALLTLALLLLIARTRRPTRSTRR